MDRDSLITIVTDSVIKQLENLQVQQLMHTRGIPLGISNRHVHISEVELKTLFGDKGCLTELRELSQPGQYVTEQTVTLVGPKGVLERVRILGPLRLKTQVEISVSDCFKLGIKAPIRDSGDLKGSAVITLVGPAGSVTLQEGCIIAARHIHMNSKDAQSFNLKDGDRVNVKSSGPRGIVFTEVLIRINDKYKLEMHLDVDEANAASLANGSLLEII